MFVINLYTGRYTGRYISTESRRYHDIGRTCVVDLTIRLPVERKKTKSTKDLENKKTH